MPTYLVHGFRWQRANIRIHIILQNLEDAAPDWIMAPASSITILNSFYTMFDFLPPSRPPVEEYPLAAAARKKELEEKERNGLGSSNGDGRRGSMRPQTEDGKGRNGNGHKTLTKRNKGSRASLGRLSMLDGLNGYHHDEQKSFNPPPPPPLKNGDDSLAHTAAGVGGVREGKKEEKKLKFNDWSVVKLLEQYDPSDMHSTSQPHAYVVDYMVEVTLGKSLKEEQEIYERWLKGEEGMGSGSSGEVSPMSPGSGMADNRRGSQMGLTSPTFSARELRRKSRWVGWLEKLRDAVEKGEEIGWFVVVCGDEERRGPSLEGVAEEGEGEVPESPVKAPRSGGFKKLFGRKKERAVVPE